MQRNKVNKGQVMEWIKTQEELPLIGEMILLDRDVCRYGWLVKLRNASHAWIVCDEHGFVLMAFHCVKNWSPFPYQPERLSEKDASNGVCDSLNSSYT